MKMILATLIALFCLSIPPADAKKGGGGGTCDWQVYYECLAAGGDRLECLARCMR
jgi:hypothetical protein